MTNHELNKSIGGANIMGYTRAQRLKWWDHLHWMDENRIVWRIFEWSPTGNRKRGGRKS